MVPRESKISKSRRLRFTLSRMETTPEKLTELPAGSIVVFGSNAAGAHGGGAARVALERFGAIWGQGEGLQGQSYAVPSMDGLDALRDAAERFVAFAVEHPELRFYLTKVGCGIAGHDESDVAPLFDATPDNVVKPAGW